MWYREYRPGPALAGVVHRFWVLAGHAPGDAEFQRAMPDGRPELIFNLGDAFERRLAGRIERQPLDLAIGPTTRPIAVRPSGRIDLVGVRLVHGAAPAVLGVPGHELLDRALELRSVSRVWQPEVLERLAGLADPVERLALLEERICRIVAAARYRSDRGLSGALARVLAAAGGKRVAALAGEVGVSPRQLGRLFRGATGMGPAALGRIARFQRVLRELERPGRVRWAALAARHGYADQPHLCREFRRFGGMAPGRYLAATRELTRHFVDGE